MFYERKIKYIDYLVDQVRCGNAGFVKLEARDAICNITINITGLKTTDSFRGKIYIIAKGQEKELCCLDLVRGKGILQLTGQDLHNLGGTGISYGELEAIRMPISAERELYGILGEGKRIKDDDGVSERNERHAEAAMGQAESGNAVEGNSASKIQGVTEWEAAEGMAMPNTLDWDVEDMAERKPFTQEKISISENEEQYRIEGENKNRSQQKSTERAGQWEGGDQRLGMGKQEIEKQYKDVDQSRYGQGQRMPEQSMRAGQWEGTEEKQYARENGSRAQSERAEKNEHRKNIENIGIISHENVQRAGKQNRATEAQDGKEKRKEYRQSVQRKISLCDNKWEQLWEIYPHITPFQDEREYLSVSPGDFVILPGKYFRLVNNSFLLHGYYNYKHLVLKKMEYHGEVRYYMGVPGNFYDREKQVAVMFGFEGFDCQEEPARAGDYGYYLMRIEL